MKKFLGIFMLIAVFLILTSANAFALERTKNVQIQFNDIKLIIDGVPVELKDVNGSDIEPFIYNGTTYLPIRAISEAVGKEVTWDGTTKTVYLGKVSNKSEDTSEDLSGKMFKYMSGEFLSKFSINEVNGKKSGELMFWHDFGNSPSDEEFFFEWQDGKWDYEVIGNRSGKKFLLNFTPTNKGLNIKVTCNDGSYYSWQTGRKGIDWINAEYRV